MNRVPASLSSEASPFQAVAKIAKNNDGISTHQPSSDHGIAVFTAPESPILPTYYISHPYHVELTPLSFEFHAGVPQTWVQQLAL